VIVGLPNSSFLLDSASATIVGAGIKFNKAASLKRWGKKHDKNEINFKRKVLLNPKCSTSWAIRRSQGKRRANERNVLSYSPVHNTKDLTI